jgi:outer membrane receptor protein involved in Fe transport
VTPVDPAANAADLARVEALMASPGAIVPPGIPPQFFQAIVDSRFVNTSEVVVSGFDVSAQDHFRLGRGQVALRASMTYLLQWKERITPAGPLVERTDQVGYPASLRAQAGIDWSVADWGIAATVHHVGGYRDTLSSPSRPVNSWTTVDFQARWTPSHGRGPIQGVTLALNVQNATNAAPPFVSRVTPLGYDPANADPLGRFVSLQLTKRW